jgi:hypothetical protein
MNVARRLIELNVIAQPPTTAVVKHVLKPRYFVKAGTVVLDDNGYTNAKLLNVYRVDFNKLAQSKLSGAVSPRYGRILCDSTCW